VGRVAVLTSGGLDSAVLAADLADQDEVQPVYVQFGLAWEAIEKETLKAYVERLGKPNLLMPVFLDMPVRSLYGAHWSTTGVDVPGSEDAIDSDYLPGRNVLLLGVTAVWCALHGINRIAIGSLLHNPYSDATPEFFAAYARLLSDALTHEIAVEAPYRGREKSDIIREHAGLPLHLTLTCIAPKSGPTGAEGPLQCGACLKCRERHDAFLAAGVPDPTRYAVPLPVQAGEA
jgi:7-cyano-7-deazaguanine synthase